MEKFKERYKSNALSFDISGTELTSSSSAISDREKTTYKENESQELSELKIAAEKPNYGLVPQINCDSSVIDKE